MDTMMGWHFTGATLRDGRQIPAVGEWLVHDGPIVPCESGVHASARPSDALKYAPGALLHRVELRGEIVSHGNPVDKYVGRERRIIRTLDVDDLLRRFACDQALSVAHLWDMPDVVRAYLVSPSAASMDATWDEAWHASRDATWYAARAAAWHASRAAAWHASMDEAWHESMDEAWHAAWVALRYAAAATAWHASMDATWYAAMAAALAAARGEFDRLVHEAFGFA